MHFGWLDNIDGKIPYIVGGAIFTPLSLVLSNNVRKYLIPLFTTAIGAILNWISVTLGMAVASRWLLKRYAQIQLSKDDTAVLKVPSSIDVRLETDEIFVPLTFEQAGLNRIFGHEQILDAGKRIQIIGDPGSGKTSVIKRIFRDECRALANRKRDARIPVIIELRRLQTAGKSKPKIAGDWLLDIIRKTVTAVDAYGMDQSFDLYVRSTGVLVLLDGLDEVASGNYKYISEAINQLSEILSNSSSENVIILTMRGQFFTQAGRDFSDKFSTIMSVQSFSPTEIFKFLIRWPFPTDRYRNATRIYADLTDRPTLREMCTNPLVLAMYVARDQANTNNITPESRTEFYESVVEELIYRRRATATPEQKKHRQTRDKWKRFLGYISMNHIFDSSKPANCLSYDEVLHTAKSIFSISHDEAEAVVIEISTYTGLFTIEREAESLRFIHLTFCEFLAAWGIANLSAEGWANLMSRFRTFSIAREQSRFAEVIPFTLRQLPDFRRRQAISDVLTLNNMRISVLCFLESKDYEHPQWENFLAETLNQVIQGPTDGDDTSWLYSINLVSVMLSDKQASSDKQNSDVSDDSSADFYKRLASIENISIQRLIAAFAKTDPTAAFRLADLLSIDLVKEMPDLVIENCDQEPFLAMATEWIERNPSNGRLGALLLAEAALRSPAISNSLLNRDGADSWATTLNTIPGSLRWDGVLERGSALEQALSIACFLYTNLEERNTLLSNFLSAVNPSTFSLLDAFAKLPVFSRRTTAISIAFMTLVAASFIWISVTTPYHLLLKHKITASFPLFLTFVWSMTAYLLTLRVMLKRILARICTNIAAEEIANFNRQTGRFNMRFFLDPLSTAIEALYALRKVPFLRKIMLGSYDSFVEYRNEYLGVGLKSDRK